MTDDWPASVEACAAAVRSRAISAREIAERTLATIDRLDPSLQAFTFVEPELVTAQATALDARLARGEETGALAGVPVGVKDLFDVKGLPTSYGSPAFEPYLAPRDAFVVDRLRSADALVVGKTRTSEFAYSDDTPQTANPTDPLLIAGGSSGGSAAAVGAGLVHGALGSDSGGSIRIPAALCGVVGLKPTYGAVSLTGGLPTCFSLDHAGPLARSVADARLLLTHMVGHDRNDPASARPAALQKLRSGLARPRDVALRERRFGVITEPMFEIVEPGSQAFFETALTTIAEEGGTVVPVRLPEAKYVMAGVIAIALGDAGIFSEYLRLRRNDIDPGVQELLHIAHAIPAVVVSRAQQVRRLIADRVARLFSEHRLDAVIAPANTSPAIEKRDLDKAYVREDGRSEPALWWGYPRVFCLTNLTGQPSLVVPARGTKPPLALQLIGKPFCDDELLDLGVAIETVLAGLHEDAYEARGS